MDDDAAAWREMGYVVEDYEQNEVYVWPENWEAYQLFLSLSDQWLITPGGSIIGLNGAAVWPLLQCEGLGRSMYDDIRQIAHGAIRSFNERKK